MGTGNFWLYLLVMFGVTYLIRVLPFVAFHRKIENKYVRSFLAYISPKPARPTPLPPWGTARLLPPKRLLRR